MPAGQRTVLGRTFREHIGGRWAISWQIYALNVPFNILAISTSLRVEPSGREWLGWGVVALAGLVAIAVGFILAGITVLRHRRERPVAPWVVAVVGGATGIFRGAVVVGVASVLGLQPFTVAELVNRMLAGGVVGGAALPLGALTLSIISTYRTQRHALIDERVALERERLLQEGEIEVLRNSLVQDVRNEVSTTLEMVSDRDARTVSEAMRETSHRIWSSEAARPANVEARIRDMLWTAVRSRPLPVVPVLLLWGVSAVGTLIGALGPLRGLANLLYALAVLWLCLTMANRWIGARPDHWVRATATMLLLAYLLTSPLSYLLFDPRPVQSALPIMLMNAIWLPSVVLLIAVSTSAVASGEWVLRKVADDVNVAEIRGRAVAAERDEILRDIAARLHGTAHSPLVAGTALLADTADPIARERLLEQVGRAVAQLDTQDQSVDLATRLASISAPWEGLVEVVIEIDTRVDFAVESEQARRLIVRIVEEGIANAYRHGGASMVDVVIAREAQTITVRITDNGSGPVDARGTGLGCRLFETAAPGRWSLRPAKSGGAELLVRLST